MHILFTDLPPEVHDNISRYLSVVDKTALSLTCSCLQQVYRPLSFQTVILLPRVIWNNLHYQFYDFSLSKHARAIPLETFLFPKLYSWFCNQAVRQVRFTHWYMGSSDLVLQAQSGDLPSKVSKFNSAWYPSLSAVNISLSASDLFHYTSRTIFTKFSQKSTLGRFENYFTMEEDELDDDALDVLNFFADTIGPRKLTLRSVKPLNSINIPINLAAITNFQMDLLNDVNTTSQEGFHNTITRLTGAKVIHVRVHQESLDIHRFAEALCKLPNLSVFSFYVTLGFEPLPNFLSALAKLPNKLEQCILGIDFSLWELRNFTQTNFDNTPKVTVPLTHLYSTNRNIFVPTDIFFSEEIKQAGMANARNTNPSRLMTFICSFWKLFKLPRLEAASIDEYFLPPKSPQDSEPYHKTISQNLPPEKVVSYRILSREQRYHNILLQELPLFTSLKSLSISHKIPDSFIIDFDTDDDRYFNDNRRDSFQAISSNCIASILGLIFRLIQNQRFRDFISTYDISSSPPPPPFFAFYPNTFLENMSYFLEGSYESVDDYTAYALYWVKVIIFSPAFFISDIENSSISETEDDDSIFIRGLCFTEVLFGQIVPNLPQLEFLNLATGYKSSGAPMILDSPQFQKMVKTNKTIKQIMFREWFLRPKTYMETHIYSRYLYMWPVSRLDNATNFPSDINGRIVLDLEGLRKDAEKANNSFTKRRKKKRFYVEKNCEFRHDLSIGRLWLKLYGNISVPDSYYSYFSEPYLDFVNLEKSPSLKTRCPRCQKLFSENYDEYSDDEYSDYSDYSGYGYSDNEDDEIDDELGPLNLEEDEESDETDEESEETDEEREETDEENEEADDASWHSTAESSSSDEDPWVDVDSDDEYNSDMSSDSPISQMTLAEVEEKYPISWFCSNCHDLIEDDRHQTTFNIEMYNERDDAYRSWTRECFPETFWGWI
ncbi:uncharacterized protein SAPINGB_P000493 [Magnusiomyces paraingens]|uniref:F-box domain-containing protein n=1 Tax=Magnusiomyces paraingens TaxID=2606893 RepID=A0A5E8B0W0_9ASCO|nr:uncharacterized protein SAPINGB_P000493 [Saprochaete ingens]VVT44669.1 unnamed protein product [Saprochaete ingens]